MFEDTTNYDFDDDDLATSFTPVFSSTQGLSQKQSKIEELLPENSKKFKLDSDIANNQNKQRQHLVINPKLELLSKSKDNTFSSPSKVVKRIFPGPAGLLPDRQEGHKSISELICEDHVEQTDEFLLCSQRTNSVFENGPWKSMTEDFSSPNSVQLYEKFSINWIKQSSALKKQVASYNAPFLAAIIQSVTIDEGSKIPTVIVTLKDSTGVIEGTILYSLYEENIAGFVVGSVLVLRQFGVLSMEDSYCVTITPNNLLRIYYSKVEKCKMRSNTQVRQSSVEKIVLKECSVEDIWKKYEDYLVEQQKSASGKLQHNSERSKPNLRKLLPSNFNTCVPLKNFNLGPPVNNSRYKATSDISPNQTKTGSPAAVSLVHHFNTRNTSLKPSNTPRIVGNSSKNGNDVTISCSQLSVKTDKEHTEIWKNLFEEVDTDALFDDF
ncbi:unnamed protein product [Phaedon cochleariae]|uniref:Homologous recombination OB-fold protein OB-fold domain-containing protein n=1 Tax=Phaedon cochleariae TaxID=80249 RepID=A0A9P0GN01_PHACE|nr:unnamed protein product [Phaedon cochleariae]